MDAYKVGWNQLITEVAKRISFLHSNLAAGLILKDWKYIYDGVSTKLF